MPVKPDTLPFHCSAGGSAVVGDGKSAITYNMDGATVRYLASHQTSCVYIPITNPLTKTAKLMNVEVECSGAGKGSISEIWVHYANTAILNAAVQSGNADFMISAASTQQLPDAQPYGINVTMKLDLPDSNSSVCIYSVTLGFDDSYIKLYAAHLVTA
jgi:hypothetical protein